MKAEFESLTLANVCDGELEHAFQEQLIHASDVFEDAERYERGKDDVCAVTITLTVELSRQARDSMVGVDVRAAIKRPRLKRVGRTVFYKPGVFTTPKARQQEMFDEPSNVTPLRTHEEPGQ